MNEALFALIKKQFLNQGGSLEEFQDIVSIWECIELARKTIAERFGDKQLHLITDCCEFLLRNLTPLEQDLIFTQLRNRINTKESRDKDILQRWMQKKLWEN